MLSSQERARLFAPLRRKPGVRGIDPDALARLAEAARTRGAIAKAEERARAFARLAEASLAAVPMNGLANAYRLLTEYTVSRRS